MRRVLNSRRSSVVERTIGNGEVESSILSGGTVTFPGFLRYLALSRDFRAPVFTRLFGAYCPQKRGKAMQHGPHTLIII